MSNHVPLGFAYSLLLGKPFRYGVMQVRSVHNLGQQLGSGGNGEAEGFPFAKFSH